MVVMRKVLRFVEVIGIRNEVDHLFENNASFVSVALHLHKLIVRKSARLVEYHIGNLDLAYIVKRRGINDAFDEVIGHYIGVVALLLHLFHYDLRVSGGLAYMVTCVLVTALDHIRENEYKRILHLLDRGVLIPDIFEMRHTVACHFHDSIVQVFYLIAGMDAEFSEFGNVRVKLFVACESERVGTLGHGVYGKQDMVFNYPENYREDNDKERKEERGHSHHKVALVFFDMAHRDVGCGIAHGIAGTVLDRLVYSEQIAESIVCYKRFDLTAGKKCRYVGRKGLIEWNHFTGGISLYTVDIEIEYDMAAVFEYLVNVDEFNVIIAVEDSVQHIFGLLVSF